MKKIYALFLCFFFIFQANTGFCAQFIEGFEDIPLLSGLKQSPEGTLTFGNEEAGYTETTLVAKKALTFEKVKLFYTEALAQMGWARLSSNNTTFSFLRENDILEISQTQKHPLKITISLKSKN
ncbi:MAG: hypothetical protein J6A09_01395 [Alphaproteobacteria bacterium]|nr:hypothetical protein [Alphaproteobacteria bacterium]